MGIVYRATDRVVGRELAYKRLHVANEAARARAAALFQREYTTLAQLAHPAIVEVYDCGNDDHGAYYTMELLSGSDMHRLAPMPAAELCRVLRDVASALGLIHARRLIHRDISPGNVWRTADGRAKLLDFGALTPFGRPPDLVGTPAFMAPECIDGEIDQRADLYSLGAFAYWALTGQLVAMARKIDELPAAWAVPLEPPSRYVDLPQPLEDLVLWLLHKEPRARPASAAEVVARLTAIADLPEEPEQAKVAYSYLAHPPLVGRDQVLAQLAERLASASAAGGGCVLIEAPAGAGRSALLEHLARTAQLSATTVLRADGSADNSSFGLARSLTRGALALHPELGEGARTRDTHFTMLMGKAQRRDENLWSPVEASERQARTLSLIEALLLDVSEHNPTLILIDDLHRADAESLALVASLAEKARTHALLLVLSGQAGTGSSDAYIRIAAAAERITLAELSAADTLTLVDSVFGGVVNSHRVAGYLYQQSRGNPARSMDLARLLLQRGLIRYNHGTFALPHDVNAAALAVEAGAVLLTRLADLSASAREVASFLSLQEAPLALELVARALHMDERTAVLACEELRQRELVSMSEGAAALTSGALRAAIAGSLSDEARRDLHRKAARALLAAKDVHSELRMHAGVHLLKAGEELEAAELLSQRSDGDWLAGKTPVPLLEAVLEILRRQGRSDEQCLNVLVPLVRGGFFGDMHAQRRHLEHTLRALGDVCGVSTAARLTPRFGAKLALLFGVLWAVLRHAFTPKKYRFGSFKDTLGALLSILSASTAAAASAFESKDAFRIAHMFEPLRAFGPDSAPYLTIEFCVACAELGSGRFAAATERYTRLLARFERPVMGMEPEVHLQFRQGILHGLAQAKAVDAEPEALVLADELEAKHVFFAPHAEMIRAAYHGLRGAQEQSDMHVKRSELLALRGGISWSSVTVMTMRALYMRISTYDLVAVVRLLPELDRLLEIAPNMRLFRLVAHAFLDLAHNHVEPALRAMEEVLAHPEATYMPTHQADRVIYARALAMGGRVAEAKRVCEEVVAELGTSGSRSYFRVAAHELGLLELTSGDSESAKRLLNEALSSLAHFENPFWNGSLHRALALVAAIQGDQAAFQRHFAAFSDDFRATGNPVLVLQIEQLPAEIDALRHGPTWRAELRASLPDELDEMSTALEPAGSQITPATTLEPLGSQIASATATREPANDPKDPEAARGGIA